MLSDGQRFSAVLVAFAMVCGAMLAAIGYEGVLPWGIVAAVSFVLALTLMFVAAVLEDTDDRP